MRVVVALGGNALLRRGQPMSVANQRENVRTACDRLAPIAAQPRARRLARQRTADRAARARRGRVRGDAGCAARRPRRGDAGHDRLPHRTRAREPAPVREAARDAADDDRGRPRRSRVRRSDQARRPDLLERRGREARRRAGLGVQARRRQHAAGRAVTEAAADLRTPADPVAARRRAASSSAPVAAASRPRTQTIASCAASRPSSTRTTRADCSHATSVPTS